MSTLAGAMPDEQAVGLVDELVIRGPRPLRGTLRLPGDKGISHRALLFAALAQGTSRIENLASGDDVARTRAALGAFGVQVVSDRGMHVTGRGVDALEEPLDVVDCGNSGTTMRMLVGLLAGRPFHAVLTGDASLVRRPMARVVEPLRAMGARVDGRDGGTLAPLAIRGGALSGMAHDLAVASAQVKTALILAGLQADGTTEIREPSPSRDHTERMLGALGAPVTRVDARTVRVHAGAPRPLDVVIPGDPSSAAFFVVAAALVPGSELVLLDVALNPSRLAFVDVLRRMGASITIRPEGERLGEPVGAVEVRHAPLTATSISGDEVPSVIDEIPVLAVAAAFADGVTEIRDAAELAVKESNRLATVADLLVRLGVTVEVRPDGLRVEGGRPAPAGLASHGDHRIAMAAAVAAIASAGESRVTGCRAVSSSYPGFAADLAALAGGLGAA